MELRDLIVTPLLIILVLIIAFIIRSRAADTTTRIYFLPALGGKDFRRLSAGDDLPVLLRGRRYIHLSYDR